MLPDVNKNIYLFENPKYIIRFFQGERRGKMLVHLLNSLKTQRVRVEAFAQDIGECSLVSRCAFGCLVEYYK